MIGDNVKVNDGIYPDNKNVGTIMYFGTYI